MNNSHLKNSSSLAGVMLVVLGLLLLAVTQGAFALNWSSIWPVFPMLAGLALLGLSFSSETPAVRSSMVFSGMIPVLVGIFFFTITLGIFSWRDMASLWPVFPLIVGIAFLAGYLAGNRMQNAYLVPGAGLVIIAVTFLTILQVGGSYSAMARLWPVFLIMAGVLLLIVPMLRRERNRSS